MKDRITAIKVNLRILLERIEKMKFDKPDYELNAKLQKVELKIDELSDIIIEIEAITEIKDYPASLRATPRQEVKRIK